MKISIVTPSFNQAQFIGRTIDSVLSQRGDFELEYIVLDGGSTDGTLEILESYGNVLRWSSAKDKGQVDAINKGLKAATGDVVGWLNSDDVLLPGALAKVAKAFRANPEAEWVHGRCQIIDADDNEVRRWISVYKDYRCRRHTFENFLTEDYVSQMTTFWKRSLHDDIGYLDDSFRFAFDHDFFLRIARRGDPVYLTDDIACFRWYETSKSGEGYVVQMTETASLSEKFGGSPWTQARAQAKRLAIINVYKLMGLARQTAARFGLSPFSHL
ncbi:MAG TPA: glycosyltransferase family 2 protein [Kofleriaceae bacterium]|jgi:glycosyltransferase involved in cell wall biosynthesis